MDNQLFQACQNKVKLNNISWDELAKLLNIPDTEKSSGGKILKDRYYRVLDTQNYLNNSEFYTGSLPRDEDEPEVKTSIEIKENGMQISNTILLMSIEESKDEEFVLNAHGYDPSHWSIVNVISNHWTMPRAKDAGVRTMMQSKITVKPKVDKGLSIKDVNSFFDSFKLKNLEKFISPIRQYSPVGLTLEIALADLHINNESLTFEQVRSRLQNVLEEVKRRTLGLQIEQIIVAQLGDIFHMDNYQRQTTSGTQVTSSGDYKTMFDSGIELMIWFLQELSGISKIELINIQGNHDKVSSYTLGKVLEAYFKDNKNIKLDVSHAVRKFREIGVNSVGWVHGDMPKAQIHDLFQKEAREVFGRTRYSELRIGHLHHEIAFEKSGVVVRYVPSITAPDEWHVENGYVGARQGTQCFLWNKETGLESIWFISCKPN